jgi:hypothetical protein
MQERAPPGLREETMRDGADPWRTGDLVYLEREINYWTGPTGYQACTTGVQEARDYAAKHGMDRVVVLAAWSARYDGILTDIVAQIDPAGLVTDCDGAEIVTMPTQESLRRFLEWCSQNVRWE